MGTNEAIESTQEFTNELMQMESVLSRLQSGQEYDLFEGAEKAVAESLGLMNISINELKESLPAAEKASSELAEALLDISLTPQARKMMNENLAEVNAIRDAHLTQMMYESEGYVVGLGYSNGQVMADAMAAGFIGSETFVEPQGLWNDVMKFLEWTENKPVGKPYFEMINDLFTAGSEEAIEDNKILFGELQKQFETGIVLLTKNQIRAQDGRRSDSG